MHIEQELKLDFKDVLIRPKRSILKSRSEVDLVRKYTFHHAKSSWEGIPIIAANMDHTGTLAVAEVLSQEKLMTARSKFTTPESLAKSIADHKAMKSFTFVSSGTSKDDFK